MNWFKKKKTTASTDGDETDEKVSTPENKKGKLSLTSKIFIGLIAGAIFGIVLNYCVPGGYVKDTIIVGGVLYIIGQGFIRLMQMLVVPLVFCSLVCGAMSIGDTKKLGTVGVRTLIFYLCTTALAIVVALFMANLINPGIGLDMASVNKVASTTTESIQKTSMSDTLLNIIPTNIFNGLAEGNMLQIILFALILGVILAKLGDRVDVVAKFFSQCNDIMMEMTLMVMKLAPIGVFCLIGKTFATIGFSAFVPLGKYMVAVLIALAIQCFIVYQILLKLFTGLNPIIFIRNFFPVMAFAFSTATSNSTIPLSIDTLATKMGVSRRVSSFTIPLGATINMDGTAIMQGVAVVFVAQAFGIHLTPMDYATVIGTATLASIGTAGIPSVGLITLTMVFNSIGLPVEGIALIMGIDRILDMARTAVNITGDAVCTTIVANMEGAVDREVFNTSLIEHNDKL
ncbi:MAG: dicarboxylate/amino acid:cation symporter [Eubacteriaceae bacterium]|nr:dicarboxylate/amino acid:cation symporter [Eubacteriaceae bacterium]